VIVQHNNAQLCPNLTNLVSLIISEIPIVELEKRTACIQLKRKIILYAYLTSAKLKFPELADEQIYFHDKDGTILEEDVILDFLKVNSSESILLIVCKIRATADELNFASASTVSIISTEYQDTDESTTSEDEISENISVVPSDKRIDPNIQKEETFKKPMGYKEKSVEGWKKFIRNRMGDEIFEFYSRNGFLKKSLRIQLVNATTSELVRMLRFIAKNSKDEDIRAAVRRRKRKAVENASDEVKEKKEDCRNTYKNVITITPEISDCVEFLRNASPQTDQEAILDRMKKTFTYRRSLDVNVLSIFPRFLDTPYLRPKNKHTPRTIKLENVELETWNSDFYGATARTGRRVQAGASPQRTKNKHTPRTVKLETVELETWNSGFYGTMLRVAGASPQLTNRKHTPRPIKHENVELDTWNSVFMELGRRTVRGRRLGLRPT
ncbi:hypothetical protein TcasGA2_TC016398, partial [Tribolium castaneum]